MHIPPKVANAMFYGGLVGAAACIAALADAGIKAERKAEMYRRKAINYLAGMKVVNSENLVYKDSFNKAVQKLTPEQLQELAKEFETEEKFWGLIANDLKKGNSDEH